MSYEDRGDCASLLAIGDLQATKKCPFHASTIVSSSSTIMIPLPSVQITFLLVPIQLDLIQIVIARFRRWSGGLYMGVHRYIVIVLMISIHSIKNQMVSLS